MSRIPFIDIERVKRLMPLMTPAEVEETVALIEAAEYQASRNKFYTLFPPDGPLRRDLYPRHVELFAAGALYRERAFMAANRVGKTFAGGYEAVCHLTGEYPDWWPGRVFTHPVEAWAAGKTYETTRDIIQSTLFGAVVRGADRKRVTGTGLIPGDCIGSLTWKTGVPDLIDTAHIKHKSGGWSVLGLKSYDQGRGAFEGTAKHFIWPDEEPPLDVYGEMLIRTATTNGLVLCTFTPLEGMSEVVLSFLPHEMRPEAA